MKTTRKGVATSIIVLIVAVVAIAAVGIVAVVIMRGQGGQGWGGLPEGAGYPQSFGGLEGAQPGWEEGAYDGGGVAESGDWDTGPAGTGETGNEGTVTGGTGTVGTPGAGATAYKTASRLTQITLTREVDEPYYTTRAGSRTMSASFKITGYLKEIDPNSDDLTMYADRAFDFEQGSIEWTLNAGSDDADTRCRLIIDVKSSGKDSISNLNIPYDTDNGRDDSGNLVHLSPWGDLKLTYKQAALSGRPELSLAGEVLIPLDVTETLQVGPNAICNGNRQTVSETKKDIVNTQFPITWFGLDLSQASFTGSFVASEPYGSDWEGKIISGYTNAKFDKFVTVVPSITFLGSDGPWQVSWDVELPV